MPLRQKRKYVIVLSGESGSGKTTVRNNLKTLWDTGSGNFFEHFRELYDVTCVPYKLHFGYEYTTRPPRPDEVGKTPAECGYKFVSDAEMLEKALDPSLIRTYHVVGDNGTLQEWMYSFIPEDEMFDDINSDDIEVCLCCSNLDAYLMMHDKVELETNFHINDIHMVVPYEVLLYRTISRELEYHDPLSQTTRIEEVLRRFSVESNPGIYTKGFNANIYTTMRQWLGPSENVQIMNTNVVRINTTIHNDDANANMRAVVQEISRIVDHYSIL